MGFVGDEEFISYGTIDELNAMLIGELDETIEFAKDGCCAPIAKLA